YRRRPPRIADGPPHRGGEAGRVMVALELAGVAARAHAGPVGFAIALVVLLVLVQAVERPVAGANQAADGRALTGALATIRDRSAAGADRGTDQSAQARILHGVDLLVAVSALLSRVLIAGFDGGLQRRLTGRRAHHPRRRGHLLALDLGACGRRGGRRLRHLPVVERSVFDLVLRRARPVGNDEAGHESGGHDEGHPDCGQLPGVHRWASFLSWLKLGNTPWLATERAAAGVPDPSGTTRTHSRGVMRQSDRRGATRCHVRDRVLLALLDGSAPSGRVKSRCERLRRPRRRAPDDRIAGPIPPG